MSKRRRATPRKRSKHTRAHDYNYLAIVVLAFLFFLCKQGLHGLDDMNLKYWFLLLAAWFVTEGGGWPPSRSAMNLVSRFFNNE
jgi:hypothetical protein